MCFTTNSNIFNLKIYDMEKLTLEYVEENKFTPIDCIKYFNPKWTDEHCDFYLWEETCFPFSTKMLIEQLNSKLLN